MVVVEPRSSHGLGSVVTQTPDGTMGRTVERHLFDWVFTNSFWEGCYSSRVGSLNVPGGNSFALVVMEHGSPSKASFLHEAPYRRTRTTSSTTVPSASPHGPYPLRDLSPTSRPHPWATVHHKEDFPQNMSVPHGSDSSNIRWYP